MKIQTMLQKIKESGNYSNVELAKLIGTSTNSLRYWLKGASNPRPDFEVKIKQLFKVPTSQVTSHTLSEVIDTVNVTEPSVKTNTENIYLKDARLKARLSFHDVADLLGVHWTLVQKWETGIRPISEKHMAELKSMFEFNTIKNDIVKMKLETVQEIEVVTNENGEQMVNGKILYKTLEIKVRYSDWITRHVLGYKFFIENEDYVKIFNIDNQEFDVMLTLNTAKEVAMLQNSEKGKEVRNYFIKMEEVAHNNIQLALPSYPIEDPIERAKIWIKEQEVRLELTKQVESKSQQLALQAPKIEYLDNILSSTDSFAVRDIAKELGMSSITLNLWLKSLGIQYKAGNTWFLKAKYQGYGYTNTLTHQYEKRDGTIGTAHRTQWTEKGRMFIHTIVNKNLSTTPSEIVNNYN